MDQRFRFFKTPAFQDVIFILIILGFVVLHLSVGFRFAYFDSHKSQFRRVVSNGADEVMNVDRAK